MTKWIQKVHLKKGALHKELGIPLGKEIPLSKLRRFEKAKIGSHVEGRRVTRILKRRVNFAINVRHHM